MLYLYANNESPSKLLAVLKDFFEAEFQFLK